tara:strand:- start:7823 stop:8842 length:1020 start_codon:yes stop_codon:yes gene_type:complete
MATITSTSAKVLEDANNVREDLGNVIFNVSPYQTPFTSGIAAASATADNHEWLTDSFAASAGNNENVEAQAISGTAGSTRTRLGNYVQIAQKTVAVTKKAEMFDRAGVPGKEMAYQLMKLGKELQMDVEKQTLAVYTTGTTRNTKVSPTSSTAGRSAGVPYWISAAANQVVGSSGGGAKNTGTDGAGTQLVPGTAETLTTAALSGLIDSVWNESGDFNNVKLMGSASTIASLRATASNGPGLGMATNVDTDSSTGEIVNRVSVYQSQFGPMAVVPNKHMKNNTLYVLDMSSWGLAFGGGKKIHTTDIATQASAEQKLLECYYTLEARSGNANAAHYAVA